MEIPKIPDEVSNALEEILCYNWLDEWEDYVEHPTEGHILLSLIKVHNWLHPDDPAEAPDPEDLYEEEDYADLIALED